MKKIIIAILGFFVIISFTTPVSADEATTGTIGAEITITAAGTGPDMSFTPSPSTIISTFTSDTTYTITTGSTKAGDNCIEYGIISTDNNMYQREVATSGSVAAATSATALPGSGWADKGGNEPS